MTIGKYPSIGMDCKRSIKGVRIKEAALFVAANMPKETPQAIEIRRVTKIRKTVLKVYNGRSLISGYPTKVMISQVIKERMIKPLMKLIMYLRKFHAPA